MNQNKQSVPVSKKPIPKFSNIEEEAEFWDTHDFTEYYSFDDFKLNHPDVKFAKNLKVIYRDNDSAVDDEPLQSMHVRLPNVIIEELKKRARRQGIGASTLLRMMTINNFYQTV